MKLRGWLVLALLVSGTVVAGCSRTNLAVVAQQVGEGVFNGFVDVAAVAQGIAFQTTEANAPADTPFTINFNNPATLGHNFVLVESPDQIQAVAEAADSAGNIEDDVDGVIARSNVIAAASEPIEVGPLAAGEYVYVCTVPGHTANMQGTLIVQ